jgi:hypothetical protein
MIFGSEPDWDGIAGDELVVMTLIFIAACILLFGGIFFSL